MDGYSLLTYALVGLATLTYLKRWFWPDRHQVNIICAAVEQTILKGPLSPEA